jgi:hypothetical protein
VSASRLRELEDLVVAREPTDHNLEIFIDTADLWGIYVVSRIERSENPSRPVGPNLINRLADLRAKFIDETDVFFDAKPYSAEAYRDPSPLMYETRRFVAGGVCGILICAGGLGFGHV